MLHEMTSLVGIQENRSRRGALFGRSEDPAADLAHAYELNEKALKLDDSNCIGLANLCEIDWTQGTIKCSLKELPTTPRSEKMQLGDRIL